MSMINIESILVHQSIEDLDHEVTEIEPGFFLEHEDILLNKGEYLGVYLTNGDEFMVEKQLEVWALKELIYTPTEDPMEEELEVKDYGTYITIKAALDDMLTIVNAKQSYGGLN